MNSTPLLREIDVFQGIMSLQDVRYTLEIHDCSYVFVVKNYHGKAAAYLYMELYVSIVITTFISQLRTLRNPLPNVLYELAEQWAGRCDYNG